MSQIIYTPEEQKEILESYGGAMSMPMNLDFFYMKNDMAVEIKKGYITNALHARPNLEKNIASIHARKKSDICREIGIRESDWKRFYKGQEALSNMDIVFRKSERSFIKSKFYADLGMDGEYLVYAYSPTWSERLAQMDNGYAYYNVLVTAGLNTKAELNLYLSMLPYLPYGESPWLYYDSNLPDMYCVEEGKYADAKDINKRLVKPSVKGISGKTDIKIPEIKKKKEGRKVVALKFMLEENSQQFLGADNEDIVPALNLNNPTVKMIHKAL